jgi:hypothetical protein
MLISFILLFTSGGLVSSYSIGLFLLLSILTICSLKNIGNLGILSDINMLTFVWCFPVILVLVLSRQYLPENIKNVTDPLSVMLVSLLLINFSASSIVNGLSFIFMKIVELGHALLPIFIGLIMITLIISVVFFWDKISTSVKIWSAAIVILLMIVFFNGEDIIAYIATNKTSLAINAIIVAGFAIVNYVLYKYTNNGLFANVVQVLSTIFVFRWLYLYAVQFFGKSGVKTFTDMHIPEGSVGKDSVNTFLSYLTDINFYCGAIKSVFTSTIKYFLLAIFLFYVWFVIYIYYKNSFEFLTTYKSLSLLGFLALGVVLLLLVIYTLSGGSQGLTETSQVAGFLSKIVSSFVLFAIILGVIIYALSKIISIPSTTSQIISIINFLLLMGLIALILSIFNFNTSLPNVVLTGSGGLKFIFDFIIKLILYIPCLIIDCSNVIREQINLAKKEYTVLIIFVLELLLIGAKFLVPKLFNNIINNDGIPITNKVYPLEMKNQVMISPIMQNMPKKSNYGVSAWVYLHPVPDNTNEAYIQNTSLINVGFVPDIQFNAQKGTLIFAVDVTDSNGGKRTVIVPSKESGKEIKLLYSRWNHIFVNFMDGGIDIFINGELIVSAPDVIPYQNPGGIIIGSSPGIYGEMCSLVYYKNPISAQNINLMYVAMKGFNPPVAQ